jgi:hypothetical protein
MVMAIPSISYRILQMVKLGIERLKEKLWLKLWLKIQSVLGIPKDKFSKQMNKKYLVTEL